MQPKPNDTSDAAQLANNQPFTTAENVRICRWEKEQLFVYYQSAPQALRSLCWNLLQEPITAQNRPALLAFMLAMDLLEAQEVRHTEASSLAPDFPDPAEVIASFWKGHIGVGDSHELAPTTSAPEREAVTAAALAVLALAPITATGGELARV